MNKLIAKRISILLLVMVSIVLVTLLWVNINESFYLFKEPIDSKIIDPTTGKKYSPERKYRYVLSSEIDSLIFTDNPKEALKYIDSILPSYMFKSEIYYQKGLSLVMIDSFKLAIKSFDKSLSLSSKPRLNTLHYKYICLMEMEQYDKALKVLEIAVEINPDYKLNMAEVYELKQDYQNSLKYYKMILDDWEKDKNMGQINIVNYDLKNRIRELEEK